MSSKTLQTSFNMRTFIINQFRRSASSSQPQVAVTPATATADIPRLHKHVQSAITANHYLRQLDAQKMESHATRGATPPRSNDPKQSPIRQLNQALIKAHF